MEATVKYVQYANSGCRPGIGFRGTKYASVVLDDEGTIRVEKVELREWDQMRVVPYKGAPYPIERAIKTLLKTAKHKPITVEAKTLLTRGDIEAADVTLPEPTPTKPAKIVGTNVLAQACAELKIEPAAARRLLRKAGLSAPYTDAAAIRNALNVK